MEIYEILPGYINVHKMHLTHRYLISYFKILLYYRYFMLSDFGVTPYF